MDVNRLMIDNLSATFDDKKTLLSYAQDFDQYFRSDCSAPRDNNSMMKIKEVLLLH
jgi:hypothetical protein